MAASLPSFSGRLHRCHRHHPTLRGGASDRHFGPFSPARRHHYSQRARLLAALGAQPAAAAKTAQQEQHQQPLPKDVKVEVEDTSWSSRRLFARVGINAPVEVVWSCLTDYDRLADFIPSLVENKCLERRSNGALLRQVGAQDVALGVKFCAACVLECSEFLNGVPESLCSTSRQGSEGLPLPRNSLPHVPTRDIAFVQVEGDFKAFRGVWRMQPGHAGCTILYYSLFVQPQAWLPVRLIQDRIEREVVRNLKAVRAYSERLVSTQGSRSD